jgi:hypothetical protein
MKSRMMPHLHFTKQPDLKELPAIKEKYRQKGGRVVWYQRVTSAVLVSWDTTHLEWIPPYSTSLWFGLRHALWTALFGWWSFHGLWCAPAAILTNVFGGVDVTELVSGPPPVPGQSATHAIARAQAILRDRGYYALILELLLVIAGVMLLVAFTPSKSLPRHHSSQSPQLKR